jgi:hypothetical protein
MEHPAKPHSHRTYAMIAIGAKKCADLIAFLIALLPSWGRRENTNG